jgi:hypothetical protein
MLNHLVAYLMIKRHLYLWKHTKNGNPVRKYAFCRDYSVLLKGGGLSLDDQIQKTEEILKEHKFTDVISALQYIFGALFKPVKALYIDTLKNQAKTYNDDLGSVVSCQSFEQKERIATFARNMMLQGAIAHKKYMIGKLFTERGPNMSVWLKETAKKFKNTVIWHETIMTITSITSMPEITISITSDSWWGDTMIYRRGSTDSHDCREIFIAPGWPVTADNFDCYLRNSVSLSTVSETTIAG